MDSMRILLRVIWRSAWRAGVLIVGMALLAGGVIMLVTPGPGLLLIVAGLAVLATEFAWAEHLLDRAKAGASKAKDRAVAAARRGGRTPDAATAETGAPDPATSNLPPLEGDPTEPDSPPPPPAQRPPVGGPPG